VKGRGAGRGGGGDEGARARAGFHGLGLIRADRAALSPPPPPPPPTRASRRTAPRASALPVSAPAGRAPPPQSPAPRRPPPCLLSQAAAAPSSSPAFRLPLTPPLASPRHGGDRGGLHPQVRGRGGDRRDGLAVGAGGNRLHARWGGRGRRTGMGYRLGRPPRDPAPGQRRPSRPRSAPPRLAQGALTPVPPPPAPSGAARAQASSAAACALASNTSTAPPAPASPSKGTTHTPNQIPTRAAPWRDGRRASSTTHVSAAAALLGGGGCRGAGGGLPGLGGGRAAASGGAAAGAPAANLPTLPPRVPASA
jgi:hypothetical protein